MEFVRLKKSETRTSQKLDDKTNLTADLSKTTETDFSSDHPKKHSIEKQKELYGLTALISLMLSIAALSGLASPVGGLLACLILLLSTDKINESIRLLGQIAQIEASQRIGELLHQSFAHSKTIIRSALEDERLQVDKTIIDYLLTLPSGRTFAISVRTILPPKDKNFQLRVYFEPHKHQLAYRKGKTGRRYFKYDPIQDIQQGTDWLNQNYPELFKQPATKIVVMAEPIQINIRQKNSPLQSINNNLYLCIDNVYIVEEKNLITLIESLNPKNIRRNQKTA